MVKEKAVEAAACGEGDFPSKKPKVDEVSGAMEDDLPDDVESDDDSIPASEEADEILLDSDGEPITDENRVKEILDCVSDSYDSETEKQDDIEYADLYNGTPEAAEETRKFKQYMKEYRKSKGFDIETYCDGGIGPLPLDDDHVVVRNCTTAVANAIKFKNKQNNTNLKFVKVIKSNFAMPGFYYATFEVEDEVTRDTFTYQSKVMHDHHTGRTWIFSFREKPEPEPQPEPEPSPNPTHQ